ncbi:cytochrome c [Wohlfahrtiimonas populi]|uniref:cytochrome c n=2 Tax=Wohlfahrtiimonas populi TaxID=1940240 RepID=UPI00098D5213|nr:cytochrome c [Wohlfahrtiimonas populi]
MRRKKKRGSRLRKWLVRIIILGIVVSAPILLGVFRQSSVADHIEQPLTEAEMVSLIPRGKELALAGDCFGCHSLPNGAMGAGGVPIDMPVGVIYSTNITPDKEYGIGNYTRADFHRALKDGIGKQGNLYPAMPFVFTHITTPDDLDALYAYIMSIPPLAVPNQENTGVFVLPVRPFLNFWTLLNFPDRKASNNPERTDTWNRGAYLVEGLAHCGACHSPRNLMMGVEFDKALTGGFVDGLAIPDITAEALSKHGFSIESLTEYLSTGISLEGDSFAGMNTVTHFSTSQMNQSDVVAMANYLLTDQSGRLLGAQAEPEPLAVIEELPLEQRMMNGRLSYIAACSGCHGIDGMGIPNVVPSLKGDAIVMMDNPQTLISVVLNGLATTIYTNQQRYYAMPGFADRMENQNIADLLMWIRAEWGGQSTPISARDIAKEKK